MNLNIWPAEFNIGAPKKGCGVHFPSATTLQSVGLVQVACDRGPRLSLGPPARSSCSIRHLWRIDWGSGGTRQCRANGFNTDGMARTCDRLADLSLSHLQCIKDLDTFETRLETRTKESSMCASHWAVSQCAFAGLRCSNVSGRLTAWESLLSKTQRRN